MTNHQIFIYLFAPDDLWMCCRIYNTASKNPILSLDVNTIVLVIEVFSAKMVTYLELLRFPTKNRAEP